MAREHCFYEDIFNYLVHGTFWAGATDKEKDKLHKESLSYSVIQGDLFYISPSSSRKLQQVVIKASDKKHAISESHVEDDTGDHLNVKSTYLNLRNKYHWKDMESDVSDFIKTCQKCSVSDGNLFNSKASRQVKLLDRAWKLVEVEVIGPLLMQEKETFLLRITDIFSKWMSYNFISEVNFKNMSDILLQEFSVMGFPAGVRVIGVENSEQFVDTFESTLKDFIVNVNKINLLLSRDNKQIDIEDRHNSCYKEDCIELDYSITFNNEEIAQNSSDCDTLHIRKNNEVGCSAEKNVDASACEVFIKNTETGCELNGGVKMDTVNLSCAEPKEVTRGGPGIDNCKSSVPMEDENLTTASDKNGISNMECSNESITCTLPQVKNYENDTQMENGAVESEIKDESSIESIKETEAAGTLSSAENCGDQVKKEATIADESKIKDTECSTESNLEANISIAEEKNEICAETNNKIKTSTVKSENKNVNDESNTKPPNLQSFSLSKNITQSLHSKKDDIISIINLPHQGENHTINGQDSCHEIIDPVINISIVKSIGESETTFKDLGDFEAFLKSGAVSADGVAGPLLYFFLAQESLLDSETQNLCRTHLQEFIKQFPDSWVDKMSYFNFHIKNILSTSFQTPSQLLFHRDSHLLGLHENPSQSSHNLYFQKELFHTDQSSRTSSDSSEGKHAQLVHEGYRELPVSCSVRRHSKYGLRKSPKPKDLLGFSGHNISPKKRQATKDTMQDFTPPLKTSRLSKQMSSVKQRAIAKILKNYSLKNPVIPLTPLPHSIVKDALQGKVDVIFLKKYIQLNCKKAD